MDKISKNKSKYIREVSLMRDVNKVASTGFPKLISHFYDKHYFYLVMEHLGPSLKDLKESMEDKKFTIKTVTMIAL